MGSTGAGGLEGFWGGAVETEEADSIEGLSELWCEVIGVVAVAEVGVGGSDSRISDWELSFLACKESLSFFFFFKNPRVGMRKMTGNMLRREDTCWWPLPIPLSVSSGRISLRRRNPEALKE